jgi:hypothetical protein
MSILALQPLFEGNRPDCFNFVAKACHENHPVSLDALRSSTLSIPFCVGQLGPKGVCETGGERGIRTPGTAFDRTAV